MIPETTALQDKDLNDFLKKVEADDNRQLRLVGTGHRVDLENRRNGAFTPREDSLLDVSDISNLMMVVDDSSLSSAAVSPTGYRVRKYAASPRGHHDVETKTELNHEGNDDDSDDENGSEEVSLTDAVAESSPKRGRDNITNRAVGKGKPLKARDQGALIEEEAEEQDDLEGMDLSKSKLASLRKFPARGKPREERVKIKSSIEIDLVAPLLPPRAAPTNQQCEGMNKNSSSMHPPPLPPKGKQLGRVSSEGRKFYKGEERVKPPVPRHVPKPPSRLSKPMYLNKNTERDNNYDYNENGTSDKESIDSVHFESSDSTPPLIDLNDDDNDESDITKPMNSLDMKNVKQLPSARDPKTVTETSNGKGSESISIEMVQNNLKKKKPEVPRKSERVAQRLSRHNTLQPKPMDKQPIVKSINHPTSKRDTDEKSHPPSIPPKKPGLFTLRETKLQPLPISKEKFEKLESKKSDMGGCSAPSAKLHTPPAVPKKKPNLLSEEFALMVSDEDKMSSESKHIPVTKSKTAPTIPTKKVSLKTLRCGKTDIRGLTTQSTPVTNKATAINNALSAALVLRKQQMVASGEPTVMSETPRTQSAQITLEIGSCSHHVTGRRNSSSTPVLVHVNKNRAKGPKRKLPTKLSNQR